MRDTAFARYIGIDYSGAATPTASLKGLRVYMAEQDAEPVEIPPPDGPRKYWSRRGIAEWLVDILQSDIPTLVGIDHAFSFPLRYFETHRLQPSWPAFLDDFQRHWPTDSDNVYVDFIRDGVVETSSAARAVRRAAEQGQSVVAERASRRIVPACPGANHRARGGDRDAADPAGGAPGRQAEPLGHCVRCLRPSHEPAACVRHDRGHDPGRWSLSAGGPSAGGGVARAVRGFGAARARG